MSKPRLVMVSSDQFGHNPPTYYYCKYLKNRYDLTLICWDHGQQKIEMPDVKVRYISRKGGILRIPRMIKAVLEASSSQRTVIHIKYFKGMCSLIRLLRRNNPVLLDIRTCSISPSRIRRVLEDRLLKMECGLFRDITVISRSLADRIGIADKAHIIPLGADLISDDVKSFDAMNLIYVGTLQNRRIDETLSGFNRFYAEYKNTIHLTYTIIGGGKNNEVSLLKKMAKDMGIEHAVNIPGPVPHNTLKPFFDRANIGVSYVPMTDYYDVQPPTKTFEYLMAGMVVIATATSENKQVIKPLNGVLIRDNADSFYRGLVKIHGGKVRFKSTAIMSEARNYSWSKIVEQLNERLTTIMGGCK
jgi:glycosyltransferase involved in cell wall biosynthesis